MKSKLICELHYLNGPLSGTKGCRWALVVGFNDETPWGIDCHGFQAKPTKKQTRKIKRQYR